MEMSEYVHRIHGKLSLTPTHPHTGTHTRMHAHAHTGVPGGQVITFFLLGNVIVQSLPL